MKNQDLSILKALLLKEIEESAMCQECGGPMYEGMCTECGYMEEVSYDKSGLKNPKLADRNKDGDISSWEEKVGSAIEKNMAKPKSESIADDSIARVAQMQKNNKYWYNLGYQTGYAAALSGRKPSPMMENHEGTDHEVSMANNSIDSIIWAAHELKKHLQGGERDIPAWIQDHITNAENYILQAAKNYHEYGQEEAPEAEPTTDEMSLQEMIKKVGSKYNVYSKKGKKLGSHPSKKKAQKQMAAIEISKQGK